MPKINYEKWTNQALSGELFPRKDALTILTDPEIDILRLAAAAGDVRMATFGKKVKVHQIHNIQNGLCPEDCGYCGQSKEAIAPLNKYKMKNDDAIVEEAKEAKQRGVYRYCMVASGRKPNDKQTDQLVRVLKKIRDEVGIKTCLSVGLVDQKQAQLFKEAGLDRLNHNLNTSENHTPSIVSTHTYQDRVDTLRASKNVGLDNCSGMIVGMGETHEDILDVAYHLKKLEVPSIPVNFLIPIEGNRVKSFEQLTPEYCLKILCVFRFVNPKAELRMAGGREGHLRGLQSLALYPANSLFIEGYLVTRGDNYKKTYRLIEDAGFEVDHNQPPVEETPSLNAFEIDGNSNILHPKTTRIQ